MSLQTRVKYINRYREIAMQFSKSGLGFIIEEIGLDRVLSLPKRILLRQQNDEYLEKTYAERIRIFIEEMGTTFIKLGQIASTRADLLPPDLINELEKLQSHVSPFPASDARALIEESLESDIDDIFMIFDDVPVGSASIGQVHRAMLHTGEDVAVKVQRPNIEKTVRTDLEILRHLALLAEANLEWARNYQVTDMIDEFSDALINELDYTIEARNVERIGKTHRNDKKVKIPEIYWDYSSKNVMVMDFIKGTPVNQLKKLDELGINRSMVADTLARSIFKQIFEEGYFHGDPHPGNVNVLDDGTVVFLDFGMVGRLTSDLKNNFGSLLISLMKHDSDGVVKSIVKMGVVPADVSIRDLNREAEIMRDKYYDVPLAKLNFSDAVNDLFGISNKYKIKLPQDFTILAKTLLTLESVVSQLDPDFSIMDVAEPFGKALLLERYNPKNLLNFQIDEVQQLSSELREVTENVHTFSKGLRNQNLPIEIDVKGRSEFSKHLDRVINRLSFSIVLLAFSIVMVGLIVGSAILGEGSIIFRIPIIEIAAIFAMGMFVWLLWSIVKSGRF
ncbi:ubiquinone biosynthesis protein [Jeotgalicoccus aerolatus]|uniref:Ubiquinone biosynthesis protein n=1 Tax=Jeotgalicoccus aerolatus TaxID=709510 RepID=A0A1G9E0X1_9STAP|nr:AarF/UbiB family protein [Jeotgalicoccus aerolatus]SDK69776.1 ubiquinone biosynthesis protein [Jeotgalicoccus aerolatus]